MRNNTVNRSNPHSRAQRMHTSGAPIHQLLLSLDRSLMPRPAGTNSAAKNQGICRCDSQVEDLECPGQGSPCGRTAQCRRLRKMTGATERAAQTAPLARMPLDIGGLESYPRERLGQCPNFGDDGVFGWAGPHRASTEHYRVKRVVFRMQRTWGPVGEPAPLQLIEPPFLGTFGCGRDDVCAWQREINEDAVARSVRSGQGCKP